jgi:hypothetical protein
MICNNCGSKSKASALFCVGCGTSLALKSQQKFQGGVADPLLMPASAMPRKSLTTGQIIAISAAGFVALAGLVVGSIFLLSSLSGGDSQVSQQDSPEQFVPDGDYGSNAYLDALWDNCADGNFEACDTLFMDSPSASEYEDFGDTCGNRNEPAGYCVDIYDSSSGSSSAAYGSYGSDSYLDALWDNCADGNFEACDTLFLDSPSSSEYEEFGDSCGNRNEPAGYCVDIYSSSGGSSSSGNYGSDSYLDSLWDSCSNGDFGACDDLFFESPSGSEYEEFGDTCGYRNEPSGYCVDLYN